MRTTERLFCYSKKKVLLYSCVYDAIHAGMDSATLLDEIFANSGRLYGTRANQSEVDCATCFVGTGSIDLGY